MNVIKYKQFIDEVYYLGQRREYSGFFNNLNLAFNVFKPLEKSLEEKRASYDKQLIEIYKKYHIFDFTFIEELNSMWEAAVDREEREFNISVELSSGYFNTTNLLGNYIEKTRTYSKRMESYVEHKKFCE